MHVDAFGRPQKTSWPILHGDALNGDNGLPDSGNLIIVSHGANDAFQLQGRYQARHMGWADQINGDNQQRSDIPMFRANAS